MLRLPPEQLDRVRQGYRHRAPDLGEHLALLHGLSYVFLTGQFNIPFPRIFDIVLSGVLAELVLLTVIV